MLDNIITSLGAVPDFMSSVDFTDIQTMVEGLGAKAAPVLIAILAVSIGLTLIPRYAKKAARG